MKISLFIVNHLYLTGTKHLKLFTASYVYMVKFVRYNSIHLSLK